jgi:hypothetical protein
MKDLRRTEWIPAALIMLAGALLLATAGGWALGFQQLWAFRFLVHLSWPLRLLLALTLPIVIVIGWRTYVALPHDASQQALEKTNFTTPLILVVAAALFWLLREHTYRGDALLKLELLSTHTLQPIHTSGKSR